MARLDLDDLVRRSKDGTVTHTEVDRAAELLTAGVRPADRYNLLYVIARSNARRHEHLVASLLACDDDPMVARLALQTLCTFWGLASRYLDHLHRFMAGVEWDYFGDVRQVAISAAGEFLRDNHNCELLSDLLALAGPENADSIERRVAVEAVARAMGEPLKEAINANKGKVLWEDWAHAAYQRGKLRYATECR